METQSWTDVPPDVLRTIFALQGDPLDNAAAASACRSWRSAAREAPIASLVLLASSCNEAVLQAAFLRSRQHMHTLTLQRAVSDPLSHPHRDSASASGTPEAEAGRMYEGDIHKGVELCQPLDRDTPRWKDDASDGGIMAAIPNTLRALYLSEMMMNWGGTLGSLTRLQFLETLSIQTERPTWVHLRDGFHHLHQLPALRKLAIEHCPGSSKDTLGLSCPLPPLLTSFRASGWAFTEEMDDSDVDEGLGLCGMLKGVLALERLDLTNCTFTLQFPSETAAALGRIPELLLESTSVHILRPPTGDASGPSHAADPIAPWTTRILRISHDLAPLCDPLQHPRARIMCGPMMVPPFVETLHLDSISGRCYGWPRLLLPPSLRVLHIDLDQWVTTEDLVRQMSGVRLHVKRHIRLLEAPLIFRSSAFEAILCDQVVAIDLQLQRQGAKWKTLCKILSRYPALEDLRYREISLMANPYTLREVDEICELFLPRLRTLRIDASVGYCVCLLSCTSLHTLDMVASGRSIAYVESPMARAWEGCLPQSLTSLKINLMTEYEWESLHQLPDLKVLSLPLCPPTPLHLPVSLTSLTLHSMEIPCDSKEIEQWGLNCLTNLRELRMCGSSAPITRSNMHGCSLPRSLRRIYASEHYSDEDCGLRGAPPKDVADELLAAGAAMVNFPAGLDGLGYAD